MWKLIILTFVFGAQTTVETVDVSNETMCYRAEKAIEAERAMANQKIEAVCIKVE